MTNHTLYQVDFDLDNLLIVLKLNVPLTSSTWRPEGSKAATLTGSLPSSAKSAASPTDTVSLTAQNSSKYNQNKQVKCMQHFLQ